MTPTPREYRLARTALEFKLDSQASEDAQHDRLNDPAAREYRAAMRSVIAWLGTVEDKTPHPGVHVNDRPWEQDHAAA